MPAFFLRWVNQIESNIQQPIVYLHPILILYFIFDFLF